MRRVLARLVVVAAMHGCGESHPQPECGDTRACPDGLVCDPPHGEGLVARCVPDCDPEIDGYRCENGAFCWGQCSAGGLIPEGAVVPPGPGSDDDCAFGLAPTYDFTTEPRVRRCARVCDVDAECYGGERCFNHSCRVVCTAPLGTPCTPPNLCVDTVYCVNPRRFARIDCDGDMDLDAECSPALVCDPEAIGGCAYPEPGTE